jgi:hypothetical protein
MLSTIDNDSFYFSSFGKQEAYPKNMIFAAFDVAEISAPNIVDVLMYDGLATNEVIIEKIYPKNQETTEAQTTQNTKKQKMSEEDTNNNNNSNNSTNDDISIIKSTASERQDINRLCSILNLDEHKIWERWVNCYFIEKRQGPRIWIGRQLQLNFHWPEIVDAASLQKFGFVENICQSLLTYINLYNHYDPGTLLCEWAYTILVDKNYEKFDGFGLADEFLQAINLQNGTSSENHTRHDKPSFDFFRLSDTITNNEQLLEAKLKTFQLVDENEPMWLFHGTSAICADNIITDGIRLTASGSVNDFGSGFYCTTDISVAVDYARRRGRQTNVTIANERMPCVLAYKITPSWITSYETKKYTFDELQSKMLLLELQADEEWKNIIKHYRYHDHPKIPSLFKAVHKNCSKNEKKTEFDIIRGPFAVGADINNFANNKTQFCFRTSKSVDFIDHKLKFILILDNENDNANNNNNNNNNNDNDNDNNRHNNQNDDDDDD